jgi:hypothetical protein
MAMWQRIAKLEDELERQKHLTEVYRRLYHVQCRLSKAYCRQADRWRGLVVRLIGLT